MDRSFLDIITNILGFFILLMLIIWIYFKPSNMFLVEGTNLPLERQIEKNFYYIELVENYVIPVGLGGCKDSFYKINNLDEYTQVCSLESNKLLNNPLFNIDSKNSYFKKILEEHDTHSVYFVFLVRPSAFKNIYNVIKITKKYKFDYGWFPYEESEPLIFSGSGRRIGVQN